MFDYEKAYSTLTLKHIAIPCERLPKAFEGYCIAQISDMHLGRRTPLNALKELVESLNAQNIDLIAITGDVFDTKAKRLKAHLDILKTLRAPVYFVSGNHDLSHERLHLKERIQELGFTFFDNRYTRLHKEGSFIQLLGLGDAYSRFFRIKRHEEALFKMVDKEHFSLLLAHQPKDIVYASTHGIDFQLSGHTHAGQIAPFEKVVRWFQPYLYGLHQHHKTWIYVTSGYGCWGINWRVKTRSEIAIITLHRSAHESH